MKALHLINADTVTTTIRNGDRLHQWIPRFQNDMPQVLDHLTLTTLSRLPSKCRCSFCGMREQFASLCGPCSHR